MALNASALPAALPYVLATTESGTNIIQPIGFVQTLTSNVVVISASNAFSFTNKIERTTFFRLAANRVFFTVGQSATHNFIFEAIANSFSFTQVTGFDQELDLVQFIGFTPRFFAGPIGNNLDFNSRTGVVTSRTASNTLIVSSLLARTHLVSNSIGFSQVLLGVSLEDVFNDFAFTQVVSASATTYQRPASQSVVQQHLTYLVTKVKDCNTERRYSPFVGSSPDTIYPAVSETAPTLNDDTLTLTFPRLAPVFTIVLKNPVFGNTDNIEFARIDRRTRGGDRKIFADLNWGKTQSFNLSVTNVLKQDVPVFIDFLNASVGKEIGLKDWEGRNWKGIIVVEETDVSTNAGGTNFDIVFEGTLI